MVDISNNGIITMHVGDYFKHPLFINAGTELCPMRYILQEGDKVYAAILEPNQPFEEGIVRKVFDKSDLNRSGDVIVILNEEDTMNILPGRYYYEVKLAIKDKNSSSYKLSTIVPRRKFFILE